MEVQTKHTRIYTLSDPRDKVVRYIGKTVKALKDRLSHHLHVAKTAGHRKEYNHRACWIRSLIKIGLRPDIEEIDSSPWNESQELEIYWISQFKTWGFDLVNTTKGEDGNLGHTMSAHVKKKLKEANSRKIYQYNYKGEFIREWNSGTEASIYHKINASRISKCALGSTKSSCGYLWSYKRLERLEDAQTRKNTYRMMPICKVLQFTKEGELIREYNSIKEASIKSGVCKNSIFMSIKGREAKKFDWKAIYEKKEK